MWPLWKISMRVEFHRVDWPLVAPLRTSCDTSTHAQTVVVHLTERGITGRGEALGVSYHGETVDLILAQLTAVSEELARGVSREDLVELLPAGGARNAVDCAFWDLEAKRAGRRAWELAGLASVKPLLTAYTLSVDSPEAMGRAAANAHPYSLLKLKLEGEGDIERVAAVRRRRPDAQLIVDANQAWSDGRLREFAPRLAQLGVTMIEQPLPQGRDDALADFASPVPLCADESCQTRRSLSAVVGKYQYINIKLDKAGGLSEALALAREAKARSLGLMVGCMAGSSLSMAPAFVVGQLCSVVDLDGPLLAAADVRDGIRYDGSRMYPPEAVLWG